MFLRKVAKRAFKKPKQKSCSPKAAAQNEISAEQEPEPIFYSEAEISDDSSEVEYIEDSNSNEDKKNAKPFVPAKIALEQAQLALEHAQIKATTKPPKPPKKKSVKKKDALLSISISVPPNNDRNQRHADGDSYFSQEQAVATPLPSHLIEKNKGLQTTTSTTTSTEEHATQATASASETTMSEKSRRSPDILTPKHEARKQKQLQKWKQSMEEYITRLDENDPQRLRSLIEMGNMHMRHEQFVAARDCFRKALSIAERIYDRRDLKLAKSLDLFGTAESCCVASRKDLILLDSALHCLNRAFTIRYENLGPFHVDTVETLNKAARVLMRRKSFSEARDSYFEVMRVREAIFGRYHPCVAVSAQALATAHARLFQVEAARKYFERALEIFEKNGLGHLSASDAIRTDLKDLNFMKARFEV